MSETTYVCPCKRCTNKHRSMFYVTNRETEICKKVLINPPMMTVGVKQ